MICISEKLCEENFKVEFKFIDFVRILIYKDSNPLNAKGDDLSARRFVKI